MVYPKAAHIKAKETWITEFLYRNKPFASFPPATNKSVRRNKEREELVTSYFDHIAFDIILPWLNCLTLKTLKMQLFFFNSSPFFPLLSIKNTALLGEQHLSPQLTDNQSAASRALLSFSQPAQFTLSREGWRKQHPAQAEKCRTSVRLRMPECCLPFLLIWVLNPFMEPSKLICVYKINYLGAAWLHSG